MSQITNKNDTLTALDNIAKALRIIIANESKKPSFLSKFFCNNTEVAERLCAEIAQIKLQLSRCDTNSQNSIAQLHNQITDLLVGLNANPSLLNKLNQPDAIAVLQQ